MCWSHKDRHQWLTICPSICLSLIIKMPCRMVVFRTLTLRWTLQTLMAGTPLCSLRKVPVTLAAQRKAPCVPYPETDIITPILTTILSCINIRLFGLLLSQWRHLEEMSGRGFLWSIASWRIEICNIHTHTHINTHYCNTPFFLMTRYTQQHYPNLI